MIFATLLGKISLIKDVLNEINSVAGPGNDYWKTLWKILGITYAAEFSSAICKDAGYQTIALQIEVFAKITILVLSLPVLSALLQTIRGFWYEMIVRDIKNNGYLYRCVLIFFVAIVSGVGTYWSYILLCGGSRTGTTENKKKASSQNLNTAKLTIPYSLCSLKNGSYLKK